MANQRILYQRRILTGKLQKLSYEEKEIKRKEHDAKRTKQELELLGRYRLIYPSSDFDAIKLTKYKKFL